MEEEEEGAGSKLCVFGLFVLRGGSAETSEGHRGLLETPIRFAHSFLFFPSPSFSSSSQFVPSSPSGVFCRAGAPVTQHVLLQ